MALTDILKKITQLGSAEIETLEKAFEIEKKDLMKVYETRESEKMAEVAAKVDADKASMLKKVESLGGKESGGMMQKAYARIIDQMLEALTEKLSDAGNSEAILKKLLAKLSTKPGKIMASGAFVSMLKKHAPATLEIVEDASVKPGFMVKYKDLTIDNQFDNLVGSELRETLSDLVVSKLNLA